MMLIGRFLIGFSAAGFTQHTDFCGRNHAGKASWLVVCAYGANYGYRGAPYVYHWKLAAMAFSCSLLHPHSLPPRHLPLIFLRLPVLVFPYREGKISSFCN